MDLIPTRPSLDLPQDATNGTSLIDPRNGMHCSAISTIYSTSSKSQPVVGSFAGHRSRSSCYYGQWDQLSMPCLWAQKPPRPVRLFQLQFAPLSSTIRKTKKTNLFRKWDRNCCISSQSGPCEVAHIIPHYLPGRLFSTTRPKTLISECW